MMHFLLSSLLVLLPLAVAQIPNYDPTACNTHPSLCDQPYSHITHLGTHNSPFLRDASTSFSTAGNQFFNVTVQLNSGVRLLTTRVHNSGGAPRLCHSLCALMDAGSLVEYLSEVGAWMQNHPSEVVTILLVNADNLPAETIYGSFVGAGVAERLFLPDTSGGTTEEPPTEGPPPGVFPPTNGTVSTNGTAIPPVSDPVFIWPTLRTMISLQRNLVAFLSTGADPSIPHLLPQFSFVFETTFESFSTREWSCQVDRPGEYRGDIPGAIGRNLIPMANRFIYRDAGLGIKAPVPEQADVTNSPAQLGTSLRVCENLWGRRPGFVLVDFWSEGGTGGALESVDMMNGILPGTAVNRVLAPPGPRGPDGTLGQRPMDEALFFGDAGRVSGKMSTVLLGCIAMVSWILII